MMRATIYLGSKCNLNCAYCHREKSDNERGVSDALIAKLKADNPKEIKFMGGEPTLYMGDIKKVVAALPDTHYIIATNGIDFDRYSAFFLEHNFDVAFSYDGSDKDLRGYDALAGRVTYPTINVSCTFYHGNCDIASMMKKFQEKSKIVGRPLLFYPHPMHVTNDVNINLALTQKDYKDVIEQIKRYVLEYMDRGKRYGVSDMRYLGMYLWLLEAYNANLRFGETKCSNSKCKKYDASGEVYPCLYIRKNKLDDKWLETQQSLIRATNQMCETCDVYSMCGAGCLLSKSRELECYFYKTLYSWFKEVYPKYEPYLHL